MRTFDLGLAWTLPMESAPHYFCVEATFCVKVAAAAFRRRSQVRRLTPSASRPRRHPAAFRAACRPTRLGARSLAFLRDLVVGFPVDSRGVLQLLLIFAKSHFGAIGRKAFTVSQRSRRGTPSHNAEHLLDVRDLEILGGPRREMRRTAGPAATISRFASCVCAAAPPHARSRARRVFALSRGAPDAGARSPVRPNTRTEACACAPSADLEMLQPLAPRRPRAIARTRPRRGAPRRSPHCATLRSCPSDARARASSTRSSPPQRSHCRIGREPELRRPCTDRVSDVAWSQVPVVPFDHARVGVPEVFGNHEQRDAAHDRQ